MVFSKSIQGDEGGVADGGFPPPVLDGTISAEAPKVVRVLEQPSACESLPSMPSSNTDSFDHSVHRFLKELRRQIDYIDNKTREWQEWSRNSRVKLEEVEELVKTRAEAYKRSIQVHEQRIAKRQILRAQDAVKEARASKIPTDMSDVLLKGATISILECVLQQVCQWNKNQTVAEDFKEASQAFLYPSVYLRVMHDEPGYEIHRIPHEIAIEVIQSGRNFIKNMREEEDTFINHDEAIWAEWQPRITDWWIKEALEILFDSEADERWDVDIRWDQDQCKTWGEEDSDRVMMAPEIVDALDIVKIHGRTLNAFTGTQELIAVTMNQRFID